MLLKKGLGLGALGSLKYKTYGEGMNQWMERTAATATNIRFSYSWPGQLRLASLSMTSRRQQEVEIDHFLPSLPSANLGFRTR